MKTKLEVFEEVKAHLLSQNAPSTNGKVKDEFMCMYYNKDGFKCAVGCLIPDYLYDPILEGKLVGHDSVKSVLKTAGYEITNSYIELYEKLQDIHDNYDPEEWKEELALVEADLKEISL